MHGLFPLQGLTGGTWRVAAPPPPPREKEAMQHKQQQSKPQPAAAAERRSRMRLVRARITAGGMLRLGTALHAVDTVLRFRARNRWQMKVCFLAFVMVLIWDLVTGSLSLRLRLLGGRRRSRDASRMLPRSVVDGSQHHLRSRSDSVTSNASSNLSDVEDESYGSSGSGEDVVQRFWRGVSAFMDGFVAFLLLHAVFVLLGSRDTDWSPRSMPFNRICIMSGCQFGILLSKLTSLTDRMDLKLDFGLSPPKKKEVLPTHAEEDEEQRYPEGWEVVQP